jgi:hypothetical protein
MAFREVVGEGRLEVLRWAREKGLFSEKISANLTVSGGSVEELRELREMGIPVSLGNCGSVVARAGDLNLLKWLWEDEQERVSKAKEETREREEGGEGEKAEERKEGKIPRAKQSSPKLSLRSSPTAPQT